MWELLSTLLYSTLLAVGQRWRLERGGEEVALFSLSPTVTCDYQCKSNYIIVHTLTRNSTCTCKTAGRHIQST